MARKWRFYGREAELGALLSRLRQDEWFFAVIRGRRRIGKTALVQQALATLMDDDKADRKALLFQLPAAGDEYAAREFRRGVEQAGLAAMLPGLAEVRELSGIAEAVGSLCRDGVVVVLDEFQNCLRGPLSPFPSLLQARVDRLQGSGKGCLIILGSVQTEMQALVDDIRAPLYLRADYNVDLGPWDLKTVFEVCEEHGASDPNRTLTLLTLFGGVPKYWQVFSRSASPSANVDWATWAETVCTELFLVPDAPLRHEGDTLLAGELHQNARSVLGAVAARGPCTYTVLRNELPGLRSLRDDLQSLVDDLRLVERQLPIFASNEARRARYRIADPFLSAWLGALESACVTARLAAATEVARNLLPSLRTLEGFAFERIVRQASAEVSRAGAGDFQLTAMTEGFWSRPRPGIGQVEIDLVAWNDREERVRFGSCKRNAAKHRAAACHQFRAHVERFLQTRQGRKFRRWTKEFALFAPSFPAEQRAALENEGWICRDFDDFRSMLHEGASGTLGAVKTTSKMVGGQ